ncbi:hypothetical protein HDV00_010730 [Rhizophlyctis rosea]|nr:hypothetical protein HDV00_010730 [Rhizophlyctis rosea]
MAAQAYKTILITGANKGIGFHAARLLAEKYPQTTILMGTRTLSNAEFALKSLRSESSSQYTNLIPFQIDVASQDSVACAAEAFKQKYGTLDVLLNNAGIANDNREEVFEVNVYGVKRTIEAFQPLFSSHPRVIVVSSEVGTSTLNKMTPSLQKTFTSIDTLSWPTLETLIKDYLSPTPSQTWPNPAQTFGAYGVSKTFISAWSRLYAQQHPEVRVAVVCPGYCKTDLAPNGTRGADKGGESVIWPVVEDGWKQGGFYKDGGRLKYIS